MKRSIVVWAILVVATCMSLASGRWTLISEDERLMFTSLIMFITMTKVFLVAMEFMEVRTAPMALRVVSVAWIGVVLAAILLTYKFGHLI